MTKEGYFPAKRSIFYSTDCHQDLSLTTLGSVCITAIAIDFDDSDFADVDDVKTLVKSRLRRVAHCQNSCQMSTVLLLEQYDADSHFLDLQSCLAVAYIG